MEIKIYPTIEHQAYLAKSREVCKDKGLSLILKGSLAKGSGTKYSDIDLLLLGEIDETIINELILSYGKPVMTNLTENPQGIMILVYNEFVSVDLEVRETLTSQELQKGIILENAADIKIGAEIVRKNIATKLIPERPHWYKVLRLIHRSLIKYLSGKTDDAQELAGEARAGLGFAESMGCENYCNEIRSLYTHIHDTFPVPVDVNSLFEKLLREM